MSIEQDFIALQVAVYDELAPAYFVDNVAMHVSLDTPYASQHAWFPIEGGKETLRSFYAPLQGNEIREF